MKNSSLRTDLSRYFITLLGVHCLASFAHFSHNAQYIAFYPGMPASLTKEKVCLAWLAVSSVGVLGFVAHWRGWQALSLVLLGMYGALGLGGLAHYTLALCSEHTLGANITIWSEVATGLTVLLVSAVLLSRRFVEGRDREG